MSGEQELKGLVARLDRYQAAWKMSDSRWCARYGKWIGTSKTWRGRMHGEGFKELLPKLETVWLPQVRELVAVLEGGSIIEEFFPELPFFRRLRRGVDLLEGQKNDRRCLVVLADTGTGKTVGARKLVTEEPATRSYAAALTHWRDNKGSIIRGLCTALQCQPEGSGADAGMDALKLVLREQQRTVFVDEAHQGGVVLMRIIKDLINETPSRFVYLALRTEFDRVRGATTGSITEARQFLGRCIKPINDAWAGGVAPSDVKAFLKAALNTDETWQAAASQCADLVRRNYNLRLLADAVEEARAMAGDEDKSPEPATVIEAVYNLAGVNPPNEKEGK